MRSTACPPELQRLPADVLDEPAKGLTHHFRATSVQLGKVNVGALVLRIQVANGLQAGGKLLELARLADTLQRVLM